MEEIIRNASGNMSGETLAVIAFIVIICAIVFADKIPVQQKETKSSTLALMFFGLVGFMYIVCN